MNFVKGPVAAGITFASFDYIAGLLRGASTGIHPLHHLQVGLGPLWSMVVIGGPQWSLGVIYGLLLLTVVHTGPFLGSRKHNLQERGSRQYQGEGLVMQYHRLLPLATMQCYKPQAPGK